jgi:hypothetical protein
LPGSGGSEQSPRLKLARYSQKTRKMTFKNTDRPAAAMLGKIWRSGDLIQID